MSTPERKKINLRRPDVMEAVQAQVLSHYRSGLVNRIREKGHVLSADGLLTIKLAKEFGFCYGVERAIDLAYAAPSSIPSSEVDLPAGGNHSQPGGQRPDSQYGHSNHFAQAHGGRNGPAARGRCRYHPGLRHGSGDAREKLVAKGCELVDTTCGDVMSVWKRVRQYSKESVTSIIHGKAKHEETKATTSQATAHGPGHYLVVYTLAETDYVCNYILNGGVKQEFLDKFKGAYSPGFDPDTHLFAVGVANQTTMLRGGNGGGPAPHQDRHDHSFRGGRT